MTVEDDINFFERVPTFALLGRQALRILAIGAQTQYVHPGEVLFDAGAPAEGGYIIQEGRFELSAPDSNDRPPVVGPYTLLGEAALFTDTTRPVTATALEPATVLHVPRALFLKMLNSFPSSARRLREILATRLDESTREFANVRAVLQEFDSER
jgi:CRP-like cAMP-binding protein